jgi:hypothetical protein
MLGMPIRRLADEPLELWTSMPTQPALIVASTAPHSRILETYLFVAVDFPRGDHLCGGS